MISGGAAACQDPTSGVCDPGQILDPVSGYCIAAADAAADSAVPGAPDAAMDARVDAGDAGCTTGSSKFGDSCKADGDCHCPTNYCAILPGSTTGSCTRTGCDVDPTICPTSWTCLNLGQFQAGLPQICYQ